MIKVYRVEKITLVNDFIREGWQPYGSPFVIGSAAYQALVLPSPTTATETTK